MGLEPYPYVPINSDLIGRPTLDSWVFRRRAVYTIDFLFVDRCTYYLYLFVFILLVLLRLLCLSVAPRRSHGERNQDPLENIGAKH